MESECIWLNWVFGLRLRQDKNWPLFYDDVILFEVSPEHFDIALSEDDCTFCIHFRPDDKTIGVSLWDCKAVDTLFSDKEITWIPLKYTAFIKELDRVAKLFKDREM